MTKFEFTTYQVRFPERGSLWTGYSTREQAEATARGIHGTAAGVVETRTFVAEVPAWRLPSLLAEIAAGTNEAVAL